MVIISFTGFSGTGKSTIASSISFDNNYPYISFNGIVHKIALDSNLSAYEYLEKYGISKASKNANDVILSLIRLHDKNIVIDGLYDINLAKIIRDRIDRHTIMIDISAQRYLRIMRLAQRKQLDILKAREVCAKRDSYKLSIGIRSIIKMSDVQVANDTTPLYAVQKCGMCINAMMRR
ncbi:MAG: hypothetical protein M1385_00190 [Candidatus Marsarchaeota archaeon]|nr:hypothetical protein [Candidatus Marsarchaeota archaeon]